MARLPPSLTRLLARPEAERRLGPFVLIDQLGRGGFAPVWLAKEVYGVTELRTAAVKLFSLEVDGEAGTSSEAALRIVEEARALCRVEHPNVVRFYALPIDEKRGIIGVAMEHVAGTPLDQRLAARGSLSAVETLAVGTAIASALSAVHRAGLVHRDVKPSNVVEAGGIYKLIDFGIAAADAILGADSGETKQAIHLDDLPAELVGSRMSSIEGVRSAPGNEETVRVAVRCGTVGYIDPVCVSRGAPATPASDLYALGAMLFECLTGRLPAAAGGTRRGGLRGDIVDGRVAPPPVQSLAPEAPPALGRLVDALLLADRRARPTSAEWVAIQLEQVRTDLAGTKRALPPESVGPFRGLGRFEEADRDVYFGRTSEIAAALEMLRGRGLVALVGPSGSGKGSLARAGVLPAVADGGLGGWPKRWDRAIAAPGQDPRSALVAALTPYVPDAAERSPEALVAALAERAQSTGWGVLLLVDQLEELATLASGESQAWAMALLARFGREPLPGVRCVVAARRDLLDPLLAMEDLGKTLVRGSVLIEPIRDVTWSDVLDQSLGAYGYALEDAELRDELLEQLKGTAGAMPLVQFALTELWHKRDVGKKRVTRAGLRALGGIAGALERHADTTLAELTRALPEAEETAKRLLLALTTPQGTRVTRTMDELTDAAGPVTAEVVASFEQARLVVCGAEGVMLAHEALLTQWARLRTWVAEAREDRLLADELERDARAWRADPEAVPLWQRRRLAFAEDLRRRGILDVSPTAVSFLKTSRRAARRVQLLVAGSAAVALLSLGSAGLGYVRSERQARLEQEQRTREVQDKQTQIADKQAQIDKLLKNLNDSETKEKVAALQNEIREAQGLPPRGIEKPASPPAASPRPAPQASAAPAAEGPAAPAAPAPTTIKVKRDW